MARFLREDDTICSIATAPGEGAIAVIRVSGADSVRIVSRLAKFLPVPPQSHQVYYGFLKNEQGQSLDETLVTYFEKRRSFTSEPTIEISCHGGPAITRAILRELISSGARLAAPGEFTYRAFINGRIDLTQAEAVLSLIQSHSEISSRAALRALRGGLKEQLMAIEDHLVWLLSRLEANIDFAAEDIEFAKGQELFEKVKQTRLDVQKILATFQKGKLLRDGIHVAIIGPPNVGKSSLLNKILEEDRVIVSDLPGTTRDRVDEIVLLEGLQFIFSDTAGLRTTDNQIEKLGITRSLGALRGADIVLRISSPDTIDDEQMEMDSLLTGKTVVHAVNKSDLLRGEAETNFSDKIYISAKSGEGIERLKAELVGKFNFYSEGNAAAIFQSRHYELFKKAELHLGIAEMLVSEMASPEFVISEVQEALYAIMEVSGKKFDDEVLDRVFKDFCLGK